MENTVTVSKAGKPVRTIALAPTSTIGRGRGSTVQIEDAGLSRLHAVVQCENGGWYVLDKNSTNGTFLNGIRLVAEKPAVLTSGDVIALGGHRLQVELSAGATQVIDHSHKEHSEAPPESSPLLTHLIEGRHRIPVWSEGTTTCRVADILLETNDTKTFRLVGDQPMLFSFKPGQFVTLHLNIGGEVVKRSYSISSSPSRPHALDLTIKRAPGGLVSNWMCDNVVLGDRLELRGPSGKFSCFNYPSRKMLFIGGGSGITPVMSMLRWIVDTVADVDVTMLVSARSPQDIIFRKELEWISSRHSGVRVIVTVTGGWTGADSWIGLKSRCDARMLSLLVPDINERHAFMCGPPPFMDAVQEAMKQMEYPLAQLHKESFGEARVAKGEPVQPRDVPKKPVSVLRSPAPIPSSGPSRPPIVPARANVASLTGFKVSFLKSDTIVTTEGDSNLLDLAEANGIEIDYGCRTGNCGSCKVRCTKGTCAMEENDLEPEEKAKGYVYACVARPTSDLDIEA